MSKAPSWKVPLILAIILAVGGSFTWWFELSKRPELDSRDAALKKLFKVKGTAVSTIKLVDGNKTFVFHCTDAPDSMCKPGDNSKWEITEPVKMRGDDNNINSLLSAIETLDVNETIDLSSETPEKRKQLLADYKLDPSHRTQNSARYLEVKNAKGGVEITYFGEIHPIGESVFSLSGSASTGNANPDENKVLLTPSYFKNNFDKPLSYWRNKKLMTLSSHDIKSFELNGTHGKFSGERKDGQWTLSGGIAGDIESIDSMLTAATYLTAENFVNDQKESPEAKEALKTAKAFLTLKLTPEKTGELPVTLTLFEKKKPGGKGGEDKSKRDSWLLYATMSNADPIYEMNAGVRNRVDKELKDFRLTKIITSVERFTAKKLEFSGAGLATPLVLTSQNGVWTYDSGNIKADNIKVQNLMDQLSGNRVQQFIDLAKAPSGVNQGLKFTLADDRTENKRSVVFWKSGDKLYARDLLSNRKEALVLDPTIKEVLPWQNNHFAPDSPGNPPAQKNEKK